jgi:hypothetical protein
VHTQFRWRRCTPAVDRALSRHAIHGLLTDEPPILSWRNEGLIDRLVFSFRLLATIIRVLPRSLSACTCAVWGSHLLLTIFGT